jgi:hypothetical protein
MKPVLLAGVGVLALVAVAASVASQSERQRGVQMSGGSQPVSTKDVSNSIRVRSTPSTSGGFDGALEILSMVSEITINNIVINRGNCRVYEVFVLHDGITGKEAPTVIRYGQSEKFHTNCSEILEMKTETDKGEISF